MPTLTVVAGPPAAGKSRLIEALAPPGRVFAAGDEGRRELLNPGVDYGRDRVLSAGREAVLMRSAMIEARAGSFTIETTGAGKDVMNLMDRAIDRGYRVDAYFVGLENVAAAASRMDQRVAGGGVGLPNAILARQFDRSFQNLDRLADKADTLVLYDNSRRTLDVRATIEHGRVTFAGVDNPAWVDRQIERVASTTLVDAQALVAPFRSPEFRDSFGRGVDGRSVHEAAMRDATTRQRIGEVESAAQRAFVNADRFRGAAVENVMKAGADRYDEAASALLKDGVLRGADGFFATERSRNERFDATRAAGDVVQALDRAKGAYDEASRRYISTVQDQRVRDRVAVPNLSSEAREAVGKLEQAERSILRNPEQAGRLFREIEQGVRGTDVMREFQRFERAVSARFGERGRDLGAGGVAAALPFGVTPDSARLIAVGSRAFVTVMSRNVAFEMARSNNSGISL